MQLKNPAELLMRLELEHPERLLLVDAPPELAALVDSRRPALKTTVQTTGDAIRTVKQKFDSILVWREDRGGSRAILDGVVKRLDAAGRLWIVTALKKVRGPSTPAIHRLELSDLLKAFEKEGFTHDREVRVSAWHAAYRFVRK